MNGFVFDAAQLGALLAMTGARGLAGIDDPHLQPADDALPVALDQLARDGWIAPTGTAGQWQVDPVLARIVRTLASPQLVVRTVALREPDPLQTPGAAFHYLAGAVIVELVLPAPGRYHIGLVESRDMMLARLAQLLGANAPPVDALEAVPGLRGEFVVARARDGRLLSGRRASANGGRYLAWRDAPQATALSVLPLNATTLAQVFELFSTNLMHANPTHRA